MDKILFVEDSASIVEGLLPSLQLNHFAVTHAADFKTGRKLAAGGGFDLIILDINLPDGNGLDLCREVREAYPQLPIIMLTAREEESTAVEGFARGATDYVRKPFGAQELLARIRCALSRSVSQSGAISYGALSLEVKLRTAVYRNKPLELTATEFDILALLVKRAGAAVSRDEILSCLGDEGDTMDRSLDSHISRLRRKLRAVATDELAIRAMYGVGYRLEGA